MIESLLVLGGGLQHNRLSVDMNARSAALFRTLVVEFDETGQVPAAVAAFERTAQLLPNHWLPKRNLGAILLDVGLPAEAIVPLGEAADILGEHPAAANVLLLQGLSFVSSGRRAEAEAALREGLRLASDERDETLLREALVTLGADLEADAAPRGAGDAVVLPSRRSRPQAADLSALVTGHRAADHGRDGREDDCGSLENCCTGNRTVGSNPTPSATYYHLTVAVRSVRTPGRYFAGDTLPPDDPALRGKSWTQRRPVGASIPSLLR